MPEYEKILTKLFELEADGLKGSARYVELEAEFVAEWRYAATAQRTEAPADCEGAILANQEDSCA